MPSNPNYAEGWMYLGQAYATLGRIDDAINAYRNVVRLQPDNPTGAAALGGLLIATSGGTVPPEAKALFQKVVDSGAQQPMAYYFLGVASVQDGNLQKAYDTWSVLAKMTPPGAPWIGMLSSQLSDISKELGKPVPPLPKE
jgi:cytochrome c-type biogenesis protein CcmH